MTIPSKCEFFPPEMLKCMLIQLMASLLDTNNTVRQGWLILKVVLKLDKRRNFILKNLSH